MSALVLIVAWYRPGDKTLSDPMMTELSDVYMRHQSSMRLPKLKITKAQTPCITHPCAGTTRVTGVLSQQRLGNAEVCPCQDVTMVSRIILIASMHCHAEVLGKFPVPLCHQHIVFIVCIRCCSLQLYIYHIYIHMYDNMVIHLKAQCKKWQRRNVCS